MDVNDPGGGILKISARVDKASLVRLKDRAAVQVSSDDNFCLGDVFPREATDVFFVKNPGSQNTGWSGWRPGGVYEEIEIFVRAELPRQHRCDLICDFPVHREPVSQVVRFVAVFVDDVEDLFLVVQEFSAPGRAGLENSVPVHHEYSLIKEECRPVMNVGVVVAPDDNQVFLLCSA